MGINCYPVRTHSNAPGALCAPHPMPRLAQPAPGRIHCVANYLQLFVEIPIPLKSALCSAVISISLEFLILVPATVCTLIIP